jgi:hypothetical protein
MKNMDYNSKKAVCSICVILVLWALGANAETLPPDPDNAALLYYQAFLLRPEPDADTSESIHKVLRGEEPDEKVRKYLNQSDCRDTIEFAKAATDLPICDWDIRYSQGVRTPLPQPVHIRDLSFLLYANARVLAADRDYKEAINRCLAIQRFAAHVGDDTLFSYFLSLSLNRLAHRCVKDVLVSMPPNVDTLVWLRDQLIMRGDIPSLVQAFKKDEEMCIQSLCSSPDRLKRYREFIAENTDDENKKDKILNLNDEKFIAYVRKPNVDFLNSIIRVIESEMAYQEKYMEIQRLTEIMDDEYAAYSYAGERRVAEHYNITVQNTAHFNALKAAIEIYLIKARTGQLPDKLPTDLPKDPFSDKDFQYKITEKGFVLRCRAKDMFASQAFRPGKSGTDFIHEYEFGILTQN